LPRQYFQRRHPTTVHMSNTMLGQLFAFALLVVHVHGRAWPSVPEASNDEMPTIELSLAPPAQPSTEVAIAIGNLEKAREAFEAAQMDKLQLAYDAALVDAKKRIHAISTNAASSPRQTSLSFLAADSTPETLSVKVNVEKGPAMDTSIIAKIEAIEQKRAAYEQAMFEQAAADMASLTDLVVSELEAKMHMSTPGAARMASFLETSMQEVPKQANIQVVASDEAYTSVVSMVQDMETRRDISETLVRAKVLTLEMSLLKALNQLVKAAMPGKA